MNLTPGDFAECRALEPAFEQAVRGFGGAALLYGCLYPVPDVAAPDGWRTFNTATLWLPNATGSVIGYSTFGQGATDGTTENANLDNYAITLAGAFVPQPSSMTLSALSVLLLGAIVRKRLARG